MFVPCPQQRERILMNIIAKARQSWYIAAELANWRLHVKVVIMYPGVDGVWGGLGSCTFFDQQYWWLAGSYQYIESATCKTMPLPVGNISYWLTPCSHWIGCVATENAWKYVCSSKRGQCQHGVTILAVMYVSLVPRSYIDHTCPHALIGLW